MIIININDLKTILKNTASLCERKNIISIFDIILIIKNQQMILIAEGVTSSSANILTIENPDSVACIIKTGFNILSKIIGNIQSSHLIINPQEQGILLIQSYDQKVENKKKKNIDMNFSIYSHNIYFDENNHNLLNEEETFKKYEMYWNYLINQVWEGTNDTILQLESTAKFVTFLKKVNYAASTDNDRAFSNIFFQWENQQIIANSSNRIRVAIGKFPTINSPSHSVKFSCDKKTIINFIKAVQNYLDQPLTLRIGNNGRIYCLLGKDFILEIGYSIKRTININEFFSAMETSQKFLCNTEEIKQAIQCGKSFATKFHYSIMIENNKNSDLASVHEFNQLRFFFQEPNHGNIETYINDYFNNNCDFTVEVNVLYLWDGITAVNTKQCLLLINQQNSYLFILPWDSNKDINDIKNNYDDAHLIMCLR